MTLLPNQRHFCAICAEMLGRISGDATLRIEAPNASVALFRAGIPQAQESA